LIEPLSIIETNAQIAAVIHLVIKRDQIQALMEPAIFEVTNAIAEQGLNAIGPLFAHHLTTSSEFFDFEVGFPVNAPIKPAGRVIPSELPAAKVARTIYHGGYAGLYQAWEQFGMKATVELGNQMEEAGLVLGETLWESYISGPETDPDPSTWRTELNQPLHKVAAI
jgi:effector-binding domain-containing protein